MLGGLLLRPWRSWLASRHSLQRSEVVFPQKVVEGYFLFKVCQGRRLEEISLCLFLNQTCMYDFQIASDFSSAAMDSRCPCLTRVCAWACNFDSCSMAVFFYSLLTFADSLLFWGIYMYMYCTSVLYICTCSKCCVLPRLHIQWIPS